MPQEFNQYQIAALQQLADYRGVFKTGGSILTLKTKPVKGSKITLQQFIDSFIEIFCQNNFADTDYSFIQNKPNGISAMEEWVKSVDIKTILQCFTYAIWTDKTFDGYFLRKINDQSAELLLIRLNEILSQNYRQQNLQRTKVTVINAQHAAAIKSK
ncbi:hypothetical protein FRZ67_15645 [Panacibacter ginsenosidivorans]|uniref:Uncharacterized protein n=1 Tax=Panacibacter ginsenosidivorans TaxID=1813871 RepID=A0A5B8VBM8_9BACT|nr:hypothetical protein [Panacibacter ginsenosidivorans]QEC68669.1 hypothetical protein FRZ67_15645 [Panacibacter ginsenosidivorans]